MRLAKLPSFVCAFCFLNLLGCGTGTTSPAEQGGEIVKQSLKSPASYDFFYGDVLWTGTTALGEQAYVVRVAYDAQNGFGALLRGCALVAYRETEDSHVAWSQTNGIHELEDQRLCQESTPVTALAELGRAMADLNFNSQK